MIGLTKLAPGEGHVDLAERPVRAPAPGEVALDVAAVGVCGTDLHIWLGEYPCDPPVTMGHEVCGTVAVLGDGVDEGWLGARVAVETFFSTCGECRHCHAGRLSVCEQRRSIGSHVDGGLAPRLVLPARSLHRVPDALPDAAAALSEPLACVCNSLLDPNAIRPGDDVLVIGPGAIGLIAAQVARACGGRVTVRGTERDEARLALARELRFAVSVAGREQAPAADVVVECSGSGPGIADGLGAARRRGRLVQMGLRGADVTVPFDLICFHELTVTAGFASNPGSWRRAMALLEAGAVELAPLVTEVVPLAEWARAFEASRAGDGVKYVLDPRGTVPPYDRRDLRLRRKGRLSPLTAVIFDCDGTLVDSEPLARMAWERALAPHGYALTDADAEASIGLPYPRVHAYYAERVALPGAEAFWTDFTRELFTLIDTELVVFDDAVGAARDLRERGIPVAIASSSPRERLHRTLARAGLLDAFDVTVAGDEVARGKPAPDMFLLAAARLGVAPETCVVIEDSPPGVRAGVAAGMRTIAVCRVPGTEASLAEADRVLDSVSVDAILQAV